MSRASTPGFEGARVATLEARLNQEVEDLVRRLGGRPVCVPALREEPVPAAGAVAAALDRLQTCYSPVLVLQTGVGVDALFEESARLGRTDDLVQVLTKATTVSRGPKPAAALARRGLRPTLGVAPPYTTLELLQSLDALQLAGVEVMVLHYGERNEPLIEGLSARGAQVFDLLLYEWRLPEDTDALGRLVDEILAGRIDVVVFTSQIQARHLFEVAGPSRRSALAAALNQRVLVGAIGPTCATALAALGLKDAVVPHNPKLGPLFTALTSALAARRPSGPPRREE